MQRLATRQAVQASEEAVHLVLDRPVLLVGGDHILRASLALNQAWSQI
jgi:hypothetical protein